MRTRAGAAAAVALATAALVGLGAGACGGRKDHGPVEPPGDPDPGREANVRAILLRELEIEVLEGYDQPTFETAAPATAVSGRVGAVHIGVGPDDIAAGGVTSVDRWPLLPVDEIGGRLDEAESKRLQLHLSEDLSAAWIADEISYRVPGCLGRDGRYKVAVVPLRYTGLFVRDGERWVEVLEHVSYPQRIGELVDDAEGMIGKKLRIGRDPRPAVQQPLDVVKRAISADLPESERARLYASDPGALAMWPDPEQELHGSAVLSAASLARSFDASKISLETFRVGMSPDPDGGVGPGTVAWVAATLRVDARRVEGTKMEPVTLRLRGTFVLEDRDQPDGTRAWQIVQAHVSAPVDDEALVGTVRGSEASTEATLPWQRPCEGQWTR
ncbi:MAG: nuclear transport factor 2 family protein [Kofleriaceae bacterium]|nr:nuclear transport factor 2 family protein [Kofleriaceae bacterium]